MTVTARLVNLSDLAEPAATVPAPAGDEAAAPAVAVPAIPMAASAPVDAPPGQQTDQASSRVPKHAKARVEPVGFDRPWVANLSTVLIAVGVLLVLLALVNVL